MVRKSDEKVNFWSTESEEHNTTERASEIKCEMGHTDILYKIT